MRGVLTHFPSASFFALAYLITWPCHILAFVVAEGAGVALGNEDNFRHFVDLLTLDSTPGRLAALVIYNVGVVGPALAGVLLTAAL